MAASPAPPVTPSLIWHLRRTLSLAWPVILSRVGLLLMTTMDVLVLGRAGAQELAFYVLGYAVMDSLMAVMAGLQLGVPVLASRSIGQGRAHLTALIWRRGLLFAVLVGAAVAALMQGAPFFYAWAGQAPDLAQGGGAVMGMLALALPFVGMLLVSTMALEAMEKPFHATLAVLAGNVLNLGLSVVLVFGLGPFPALGAWGCALATVITMACLGFGLSAYVRFAMPDRARFGFGMVQDRKALSGSEQIGLGYAAGASYGLEAASFAGLTLIAGLLGVIGLASMGVLFQLFAITFMISFGIAGATQVRVGNAWGREDARGMAQAGWAGFGLSLCFSLLVSSAFLLFPAFFIGLLTTDQQVIAVALPVMIWMVMALCADGGQTVLNHACRGRGDRWVPTLFHMVSYWLIMLPAAWLMAIVWERGPAGLYQAIVLSSLVSFTAMATRFLVLSRRGLPEGAKPDGA